MFSTLLEDSTDTLYDSGIQTVRRLPLDYPSIVTRMLQNDHSPRREGYTNMSAGQFNLTSDTGTSVYSLQNHADNIQWVYAPTSGAAQTQFMNIGTDGLFTFNGLAQTANPSDTNSLVPVVVDQNGKISRGYVLYQHLENSLTSLANRVTTLESVASPTIYSTLTGRLSTVETLSSTIQNRINNMKLGTPI